jgi:hypothetical protein
MRRYYSHVDEAYLYLAFPLPLPLEALHGLSRHNINLDGVLCFCFIQITL